MVVDDGATDLEQAGYRALIKTIDDGFCIIKQLFDAEGRPHDYRILNLNAAFER